MEKRTLLKLAELDGRLSQLRRQKAGLVEALEIPKYKAGLERARRKESRLQEELGKLRRRNRSLELDLEKNSEEIRRLEADLYGGQISSSKELAGLQARIEGLRKSRAEMEDQVLNGLEEQETLEAEFKKTSYLSKRYEAKVTGLEEELAEKAGELEETERQLLELRRREAAVLPEEFLRHYEEVAKGREPPAAVAVRSGVCGGCHLPVAIAKLQKLRAGSLERCESCGRILCLD